MKKTILLIIAIAALFNLRASPNISSLTQKAKQAEKNQLELVALKYYNEILKLEPNNGIALQGAALMYSNIGSQSKNSSQKEKYYATAMKLANKAIKLDSKNAQNNFVKAVVHGREIFMTNVPKTKIKHSALMKKYAQQAVTYNPNHKNAWALLALWHYERASISKIEKYFVKLIGGLPAGSYNEALRCAKQCQKLDKNHVLNLMTFGNIYNKLRQPQKAKHYWQAGLKAKSNYSDDKIYKAEIKKHLSGL